MPSRILLLGGSTEATELAGLLAREPHIDATLSLAGRTESPVRTPLTSCVGGFGGAEGLAAYLRQNTLALLIDATHPFAAQISNHAIAAAASTGNPQLAVERPPWTRIDGDDWIEYDTIEYAFAALPEEPQDVFSGLGRQAIAALCRAPQHRYLVRVVDPMELPLELAHAEVIAERGPFRTGDDARLFADYDIRHVLSKNAGGSAAYSKIEAARQLGITVHMVRRPAIPGDRATVTSASEALKWVRKHHRARSDLGV